MEKLMNLNDFKEKPKKTDKQMEEIRERVVKRALEMYKKNILMNGEEPDRILMTVQDLHRKY